MVALRIPGIEARRDDSDDTEKWATIVTPRATSLFIGSKMTKVRCSETIVNV